MRSPYKRRRKKNSSHVFSLAQFKKLFFLLLSSENWRKYFHDVIFFSFCIVKVFEWSNCSNEFCRIKSTQKHRHGNWFFFWLKLSSLCVIRLTINETNRGFWCTSWAKLRWIPLSYEMESGAQILKNNNNKIKTYINSSKRQLFFWCVVCFMIYIWNVCCDENMKYFRMWKK